MNPEDLNDHDKSMYEQGIQYGMQVAMRKMQGEPPTMYVDEVMINLTPMAFYLEFIRRDPSKMMGANVEEAPIQELPKLVCAKLIVPPVAYRTALEMMIVILNRYEYKYGPVLSLTQIKGVRGISYTVAQDAFLDKADILRTVTGVEYNKPDEVVAYGFSEESVDAIAAVDTRMQRLRTAYNRGDIDKKWLIGKVRTLISFEEMLLEDDVVDLCRKIIAAGGDYITGEEWSGRHFTEPGVASIQYEYRKKRLQKAYASEELSFADLNSLASKIEIPTGMWIGGTDDTNKVIEFLAMCLYVYKKEDPIYVEWNPNEQGEETEDQDEASEDPEDAGTAGT